ncbi:hypothetical protein [Roseivirga sp. E12]|uniref:hypothetical protein n=1 Tax=Roseivirga sp. E12 TaxID=2819237 RepID=UPI001ABD1211|nr:hypothetical protein [Roseivirga sp. E12]MBO3697299.1 hypothetical protein [Roseivirga sp. E12]
MNKWRTIWLLSILFTVSSLSIAQNKKDSLVNVGLALYADEEYNKAANIFDQVVREEQVQGLDFFNAARMWAKANDSNKAFDYLRLAFNYGFIDLDAAEKSNDLRTVRRSDGYRKLIAQERAFQADSIISMVDMVRALIDRNVVIFDNKRFVSDIQPWYDDRSAIEDLILQVNDERVNKTPEGHIDFRSKSLIIKNSRGPIHLNGLALKSLEIRNSNDLSVNKTRSPSSMEVVQLTNLDLGSFSFNLNGQTYVRFFSIKAYHVAEYSLRNIIKFYISDSDLEINTRYRSSFEYELSGSFGGPDAPLNDVTIRNTVFRKSKGNGTTITALRFFNDNLFIENCIFENEASFGASAVKKVVWPQNRFLKPVDLSKVEFEKNGLILPYRQFEAGLGVIDMLRPWKIAKDKLLITGDLDEVKDDQAFSFLISSYKFLLDNYERGGDKESKQEVFLKLKKLYSIKDRQLLNEQFSITDFLDYQVNRLSGLVSNYGTSAGKVVWMSFLTILFFTVVYSIFNNDSQSTRLKTIIARFSTALMMSVMAQITLRASKGASLRLKWLCIVQGLIGWTLFSFFITALLYQVSV